MFRLSTAIFTALLIATSSLAFAHTGASIPEDDRILKTEEDVSPLGPLTEYTDDEGQTNDRKRHLRRESLPTNGRHSQPRHLLRHLEEGDGETIDEDLMRVIVKCPTNMPHEQCLDDLQQLAAEAGIHAQNSIEVIHDLGRVDAVALSLTISDIPLLEGYDYHEDPVREPLYIKDSVVVEDFVEDAHAHGRNMQSSQPAPYGINLVKAPSVWDDGEKGANAMVCVLDTGLRATHADLDTSKMTGYSGSEAVTPWDTDSNGHGTHVTGTIAASDNTFGVVGVAPEASIYTVRVFNRFGIFSSDLMAAADACRVAGADIISMSLGGGGGNADERDFFEKLYNEDGILSVAASGNSGANGNQVNYPAAYDVVVSVGAVDSSKNLANFSTRNSRVDLSAPGVNVRSTWRNGGYSTISGTSMVRTQKILPLHPCCCQHAVAFMRMDIMLHLNEWIG
mmetsp:Transcript_3175/g.8991  ORF Transcript_3175/g.8991 Transcript_3175/m.8991 type:complete len:451 (-) Transcript_3175:862-2214(-)